MRKIIILFLSLLCSTVLFSQHNAIKVNGLKLFKTYTEVQIFEALGNPTNSIYPCPEDDIPDITEYRYNECGFVFQNGEFYSFGIRDTIFKINGYLSVGMDLAAIAQMSGFLFNSESSGVYCWAPSEEYRNNIGYITIHTHPITQKITLIAGESSKLLL